MPDSATLLSHEPDHIIAIQHGGTTSLENLAYTCHQCNRYKGPNLASIDPETGERAFLFNPRTDAWQDHFRWEDARIKSLTAVGRATAELLRFNRSAQAGRPRRPFRAGAVSVRHAMSERAAHMKNQVYT